MRRTWMAILGVGLLAGPVPTGSQEASPAPKVSAEEPAAPKTEKDKVSYGIGVAMGRQLKNQLGFEFDLNFVEKGLRDAASGQKLLMTEEDLKTTMTAFQTEMAKKQEQARKQASEENKKAGEAFLAENKTKEGVVTLPSGLQYKILKAGDGKKPTLEDTVVCQYRGTLLNGTEFDSSYKRGQPVTFPVKGVIKGWTEALQLMPVGSKWQLFIPPELAYGERGAGGSIGPNATLIFEVDLVSIQGK